MQLVSTNIGGNLHEASNTINKMGLAEFVLKMDFVTNSTIVVFRVSDAMAPELRKFFRISPDFIANPLPKKVW